MNHIKDMNEENIRAKMEEENSKPAITPYDRVYKPTYTI